MFEFFFTLTTGCLGYVAWDAYQTISRIERGEPHTPSEPVAKPAPVARPSAPAAAVQDAAPVKVKPAATPTKPAKAPAKAKAPARKGKVVAELVVETRLADALRNPATGEVTPVPTNYRFAKKWIKDALVAEKLLDRIYKPNELDAVASEKIRVAMDGLRAIHKYQG